MIAPGVERVDTVKTDTGYEMKSIWSRNDLSDTSITQALHRDGLYLRLCAGSGKRHVAVDHSGL